jgi:hypothetical protein
MLLRQTLYLLGKYSPLANFPARNSGAGVAALRRGVADFRRFLNRAKPIPDDKAFALPNNLESAVFMFHMRLVTLRIIRSLRAACSEPVQRFLACPFS